MTRDLDVDDLMRAVGHGDARHRAWLRAALTAYRDGLPIPVPDQPPRRADVGELLRVAGEHAQFPADVPSFQRTYFFGLELCGEAGEVANALKKVWRGDAEVGTEAYRVLQDRVREELVDTVVVSLFLAHLLGTDVLGRALDNMRAFERTEKWTNMVRRAALGS